MRYGLSEPVKLGEWEKAPQCTGKKPGQEKSGCFLKIAKLTSCRLEPREPWGSRRLESKVTCCLSRLWGLTWYLGCNGPIDRGWEL